MTEKPPTHAPDEGTDLITELKKAVRDTGDSLSQIARDSGLSQSQLSRFINLDKSLSLASAAKLFTHLRLKVIHPIRPASTPAAEQQKALAKKKSKKK